MANILKKIEIVSVELQGVSKSFGEGDNRITAVNNFSLKFSPGKLTTLLGPSGCGKTTTIRCIAGFCEPDEGEIFISEKRVNGIPPYSRPTGTVFQNYALFPHLTVFDNIAYGLKIKKLPKEKIRGKVFWALDFLDLKGMEQRFPSQISGGQQQRVAIARVLVTEPKVILFDEPLSNLDAKLRVQMRDEIRNLQKELGITTIYVTHDQEEAMSISDCVAVMNKGIIEQVGTPQEIYHFPKSRFMAEFIGIANLIEAEVERQDENKIILNYFGEKISAICDDSLEIGQIATAIARPEMIRLDAPDKGKIKGRVYDYSFLGSIVRYKVKTDNDIIFTIDYSDPKEFFEKGSLISLTFDKDLYVLPGALCQCDPHVLIMNDQGS